LVKKADEQLTLDFGEIINSFDDYLNMYNESYIAEFLLNKYVELATSENAIKHYIKDCDEPAERVNVLENLDGCEIFGIDDSNVADDLLNEYKAKLGDDYTEREFENDVADYVADNLYDDIVALVTENISEFLENEAEKHNSFYYKNSVVANELCNIDDSIGEESEIIDTIDFDNRDAAFVDLDGEILVSDNGMTHAQLINEYLKEYDEELNDGWYRPDVEEIENKSGAERVAFGHIVNDNVWIIDDGTLTDISAEDVANDIKASGNKYTKIYSYDMRDVTRVAQLEEQK
jgi:6-pyruvoyl-tetrahydropterin synthase